jgi:hypothetical protein
MERARRWVTMRMIGEMGAIFCGESSFFWTEGWNGGLCWKRS